MLETDLSNTDFQIALQFVNQTAQHIFLTGKAGTGKTTFLKWVRDHCSKKMVIVAPTGVAAINAGGVTMHSFFQLPFVPFIPGNRDGGDGPVQVSNEQTLLKNIRFSASKKDLLLELDLLVIDEVSMLRADMLDAIDAVLRFFRKRSQPFGGIQVLFIGDLYQLPPVVHKTDWEVLRNHYQSPFFFDAQVLKNSSMVYVSLKKIYRQKEASFIDLLNSIRNNDVTGDELDMLHKCYDPDFQPAGGEQYIILTTHNDRADAINRQELDKLSGFPYSFEATVTGDFDLRSVTADNRLFLKKGAQVMFVKNDKGENRRYFNGKIAAVSRITQDEIWVCFPGEAGELQLEKETWKNIRYHYNREKGIVEEETIGSFTQYPVKLAWAITIHKSQGLTFDKAIIDAGASFAPGQVYVALSRLTSLTGLVLRSRIQPGNIVTNPHVAAFSRAEESSDYLRERLHQEQAVYVLRLIEEAFQWNKLSAAFRNHYELRGGSMIPVNDPAAEWAERMFGRVKEEAVVCEKFGKQLTGLLASARENGYQLLQPRIEAACNYFLKVTDLLMTSLEERKKRAKSGGKAKKYLKELTGLERVLFFKKEQLKQALKMGRGLQQGMDVDALFDMVKPERSLQEETGKKVPVIQENVGKEASKLKKGETQRASLDLFKGNKSIPEIARIRGLAITTIENHLASFVKTGEIDIHKLVTQEKIGTILDTVRELGETRLSSVKNKLGAAFSYLEIKAVVCYLEREPLIVSPEDAGRIISAGKPDVLAEG